MIKPNLENLILAANQKINCDLVIKNASYLNVFTNSWIKKDIGIYKGIIVGTGDYKGDVELDYKGYYLIPGLIDAHVHIESSLGTPEIFAKEILPFGTTTIIADPHEIANVSGTLGLKYIFAATQNLPLNAYIMIPSCVPASAQETSGAKLEAKDLKKFLDGERTLGLGEVMNNVFMDEMDKDMIEKLKTFSLKTIDGHAPGMTGTSLNAYRVSGICNDHECSFEEETLEKVSCGFNILAREGSACKNETEILKCALKYHLPFSQFAFCTDDKHISDIRKDGHISYNVNLAISLGVNPIEAIKMATYYPSKMLGLKSIGAIAPTYEATFVVIKEPTKIDVKDVFFQGKKVVSDSKLIAEIKDFPVPTTLLKSFYIEPIEKGSLRLKFTKKSVPVINIRPGEILTKMTMYEPKKNYFAYEDGILKIVVLGRHKSNFLHKTIGLINGYDINGAIASSVAHDSHNIIAIGSNDEDLTVAINELIKMNGGYVLVQNKEVKGAVPLNISGILSSLSPDILFDLSSKFIKTAHEMGVSKDLDILQPLSFSGLSVIPEIRITDLGIIDVLDHHKILEY